MKKASVHGRVRRLGFAAGFAIACLATASVARAQQDTAGARAPDSTAVGAPVVVGIDTLFRLFGNLGPFTASDRAAAVTARLRVVGPELARGDSIVVTDLGAYSELSVGDAVLMTVLDADAHPTGIARPELAEQYAARIRSVLIASVAGVGVQALLVDAAYAVVTTAVLVTLLWLIALGFPKLYARIESLQLVRLPALRIQNLELMSAGRLSALLVGSARVLRVLATLLLFYIYVPLVLGFFPWTAPLSRRIIGYALRPFAVAWFGFVAYLPNLFYLAAGIVIVRYILIFLHKIADALGRGAITFRGFYPEWSEPTYKIVRVMVFAFAAMALYPYLPGASSDAFKGVSIFVGVLFSLGSSSAIGNMVAGVVLTYTRAFQIGDRVQIGKTFGDVTEKTLLVTRIRTVKNVAVTIPNGTVLADEVVNFTTNAADRGIILHTGVTIGYDVPWKQVHALLIDAAGRTEHVRADPAPFVLQTSLDDFYVAYEINATTSRPDLMAVTYSELHHHIQDAFNEAGVEILSPHYAQLRDGNQTTIPANYLPPDYRAPAFRVDSSATP